MSLLDVVLPSRLFVSDTDEFLRDYHRAHPETAEEQKEALQLWWGHQGSEIGDQGSDDIA